MPIWVKVLIVTLVFGIPAFLLEPPGPLGGFWAPAPQMARPSGVQVPLFMVLGLAEGLVFGLGVAFLAFGYSLVQRATVSRGWTWAVYLAIAWSLINWWPHDSLHVHNGLELDGLLAIDYVFHITLMIGGLILAYFFVTTLRRAGAPG